MSSTAVLQKLGGAYQPVIKTPADLELVFHLDEARWMATSAPVDSFVCDPEFLRCVDTDHNGRIRADEVKESLAGVGIFISRIVGLDFLLYDWLYRF